MPLSYTGIAAGLSPIRASHITQILDWITGVMTDQPGTIKNTLTATALIASGLTGAASATRYVGGTASGAPTSGTFQAGDFVIDQTGKVWICTVAGTPGTWAQPSSSPATIASAATLPLANNTLALITGTTTITDVTGVPPAGTLVTLGFQSPNCQVSNLNHWKLIGTFTSTANSVLVLLSDGANLSEVYRSPGNPNTGFPNTWTATQTFAGNGITLSAANAGIEHGSTSAVNTPYIDFHSSGNAVDYDARLIASGGTATAGLGTLTVYHGGVITAFGGSGGISLNTPTGGDKGAGTINVTGGYYVNGGQIGSYLTNSLAANVLLNNTTQYFDGPSVAQGTSGIWLATGTVSVNDSTSGAPGFHVKLWDGTNVGASTLLTLNNINPPGTNYGFVAISAVFSNPAGNIRISVKDVTSTSGTIVANATGNGKDSTITVVRIG
jgi:hypothetical protein